MSDTSYDCCLQDCSLDGYKNVKLACHASDA